MVNIERPNFDQPREQDGFRARRAGISRQAGAERLGLSLWEVEPGQAASYSSGKGGVPSFDPCMPD